MTSPLSAVRFAGVQPTKKLSKPTFGAAPESLSKTIDGKLLAAYNAAIRNLQPGQAIEYPGVAGSIKRFDAEKPPTILHDMTGIYNLCPTTGQLSIHYSKIQHEQGDTAALATAENLVRCLLGVSEERPSGHDTYTSVYSPDAYTIVDKEASMKRIRKSALMAAQALKATCQTFGHQDERLSGAIEDVILEARNTRAPNLDRLEALKRRMDSRIHNLPDNVYYHFLDLYTDMDGEKQA